MSILFRSVSLGLLLFLLAPSVSAQYGGGGVDAVLAIPQGQFADRLDGIGYGLSGNLVLHIPNTPVGLGIEGTFVTYGRETIRERFGSGALGRVEVDVETTNNILLGHLLLRLQSPSGALRPYADALVGVNYLFTESRIADVDFGDDRDIASSTNFDDAAFSYGLGGGVMAQVFSGRSGETGRPYGVFIDARVRYLLGGKADYLQEGDIGADSNGDPIYTVTQSSTDLLLPQLGMTIRF